MQNIEIGIIGGSGLYQMDELRDVRELNIDTPFGAPSDLLHVGKLGSASVAFLARHGRGHRLIPGEIPYRANIWALRSLGVRHLLSFSAVGSLCEHIAPLDMVIPDQFIDMSRQRVNTFFGDGVVAHVSMAQPVCAELAGLLAAAVEEVASTEEFQLHRGGTYVCIEGPQFSTLAESSWYRALGAQVIGMTNMPEAKLAREAQMAYCSLAMVTDYDCWHPRQANVTADIAIANLGKNAERARCIAMSAIKRLAECKPASAAHSALRDALVTPLDLLPPETRKRIDVFFA